MRPMRTPACSTPAWRSVPASSNIVSFFESDSARSKMTIALTAAAGPTRRLFLGVERSACGRAWRDRLDERGAARALAITQRHDDVPELLARILAGRGIEVDAVARFLDPTVRALMPDPDSLADMRAAALRLGGGIMRKENNPLPRHA